MAGDGFFGGVAAGVGHEGEVFEEPFAVLLRDRGENLRLEGHGEGAQFGVFPAAGGQEDHAARASVGFMGAAFHPAGFLHPFQQGGDGVRVAAHQAGEFALGEALAIAFAQAAEGGELVRRGAGAGYAAAEGLVQSIPRAAQQGRQAAAVRRVNRQLGFG